MVRLSSWPFAVVSKDSQSVIRELVTAAIQVKRANTDWLQWEILQLSHFHSMLPVCPSPWVDSNDGGLHF